MKSFLFTALAAVLFATSSAATQPLQHAAAPSIIRLPTHRKTVQDPVIRDALRRRQTVTETLDNGVSSHSRIYVITETRTLQR